MPHPSQPAGPSTSSTRTVADRRQFLSAASAGALAFGVTANTEAQEGKSPQEKPAPVLDSQPTLQHPTPDGVTIVWAVGTAATGWVEYGETKELGERADAPRYGLNPYSDRFLSVRLSGLQPGKAYFYRVVVRPIAFHTAYRIEPGEPVASDVYQFTLLDRTAESASFAVINDTHENTSTLQNVTAQLAAEPADMTIWNGDLFNDIYSREQIVEQVLRPAGAAYAAERPVLFVSGNHDVRGPLARDLSQAIIPWSAEEPLGRCFAVRQGPLACIGLDTGEDKPDRHPVFAGLANFEPYRAAQRDWLIQALKRPEIASAPFAVVFCHIPLWGLPGHNGGDTLEGYAYYCRNAQELWHPVLEKANVQLVISAHMHQFRYDAPTDEHSYGQIVGGGPQPKTATLIRGQVTKDQLEVVAYNLEKNELGHWKFAPRKV